MKLKDKIKENMKDIVAEIVYVLFQKKILKNSLKVMTIDETLNELIDTEKSIVRFGDSDIVMICGRTTIVQESDAELSRKLMDILKYDRDDLLVAIPDIFGSLDEYSERSRKFWKKHLLSFRSTYIKYCDSQKTYCNAFLSRMYYNYKDKSDCKRWLERFKEVWEGKDILFVEGAGTHNGVGNDLFDHADSIERIICPPQNAYFVYDKILEECLKAQKNKMVLLSLGSTAKALAMELYEAGYRVIDIGNLDMEYEWFLRGAVDKQPIKKHTIIGKEANLAEGYTEYWNQITAVI